MKVNIYKKNITEFDNILNKIIKNKNIYLKQILMNHDTFTYIKVYYKNKIYLDKCDWKYNHNLMPVYIGNKIALLNGEIEIIYKNKCV